MSLFIEHYIIYAVSTMYDEFEPVLSLQFLSAYMHADPSRACADACTCYIWSYVRALGLHQVLVGTLQPLVAQPVWYVLHTALQSFKATFISVIVNGSPGHPHSKQRWRDSIHFFCLHYM